MGRKERIDSFNCLRFNLSEPSVNGGESASLSLYSISTEAMRSALNRRKVAQYHHGVPFSDKHKSNAVPIEGAEDGALPSWGNQMNIQNKLFLSIIKEHQQPRNFFTSKIGCDGYWFDNWQDHVAYVGKYMLTKEEKSLLTDDEKNVIVMHMGNR